VKVLWHSNAPWAPTGYGQQTALFAPRIRDLGHDVALSAFYGLEGATLEWDGMHVYPTDVSRFGRDLLHLWAAHHAAGGDVRDVQVIALMDSWCLTSPRLTDLRVAMWTPVDHAPTPPRVIEHFQLCRTTPIAMSRFGAEMLADEGLDPLYVPHGVDTSVFRPVDEHELIRREMRVEPDVFVVGMVANNQGTMPPRKAFPQVFQAFARFVREVDGDAVLYLHTDVAGMNMGLNLLALSERMGIPDRNLRASDQLLYQLGYPAEGVARLYNGMDVLANPSYGEGFGIPIVEAQACGTPVIVSDWTAMPELCGAGWIVTGEPMYDPTQGSFYLWPSPDSLFEQLCAAYEARSVRDELAAAAVAFAAGYDVELVMRDYWLPVLDQLEHGRVVPPLNREQRRAAAKGAP